jgi:hypothetical protein
MFVLLIGGAVSIAGKTTLSPSVGWVMVGLGLAILFATFEWWIKAAPGLLLLGAVNGVLMTITGHVLNSPGTAVNRSEAATVTALFLVAFALSFRLRQGDWYSRGAWVIFVAAVLYATARNSLNWLPFAIGDCALGIAAVLSLKRGSEAKATGR